MGGGVFAFLYFLSILASSRDTPFSKHLLVLVYSTPDGRMIMRRCPAMKKGVRVDVARERWAGEDMKGR